METKQATIALKAYAVLGEGAFWNYKTQELYWVDIEGARLHVYDPVSTINRSYDMPSRIGTVVPAEGNTAVVALEDGVYKFDLDTQTLSLLTKIEADKSGNRLNDGKCDPRGRLWVGSMSIEEEPHAGGLYRVDPDGNVTRHLEHVTISNGIVWTSDQRTMYYIDTNTHQVWAYDFDVAAGTISGERLAVYIEPGMGSPDGMTIDEEDMIWVALWEGSAVARFNPVNGELLEKIDVPALKVTSCAFGGPELDTLFITSASINLTSDQQRIYPDAGSLFSVKPGVKGVKAPFFGG